MNFAPCLHVKLANGEYTDTFQGGFFRRGGVRREDRSMAKFLARKRIFHGGVAGFPGIV